jgi:hypothetical protein
MKPDQLNLTLFYVLLGQVLSIGAFFLFSYLKQKGQNFATKEDIGAITGKIESAKGFYTERLEQLKAELSSRGHYSRVRYEREMEVYKELWPQVCDLAKAVRSLRPVIDSALKAGENEQERKTKRHQSLEVAFDSLANTTEKSRPFYPPEIWKELRELLTLCVIESSSLLNNPVIRQTSSIR